MYLGGDRNPQSQRLNTVRLSPVRGVPLPCPCQPLHTWPCARGGAQSPEEPGLEGPGALCPCPRAGLSQGPSLCKGGWRPEHNIKLTVLK